MRFGDLFRPHEPIARNYYVGTLVFSLILIFGVWSLLSYSGVVKPSFFLPTPTQVVTAFGKMIETGELIQNTQASVFRVIVGWVLAAIASIPVGILMGSFKIFEAFFEPFVDFVRYLPVSAMIPLLILYIGLGEEEKIAVIFIGTFFQLVLMVADATSHVAKDLIDSAYTLGVSRWRIMPLVLIPATLPGIMDALRITLGWAWTYLIVAELVAADRGLGIMILESQRGLRTDKIFAGLITIGLLGFISDFIFKWLHRVLLPWSPRLQSGSYNAFNLALLRWFNPLMWWQWIRRPSRP
ncbi:MAG: ABC transporter permease [Anaerolineae bacterium]|nr:ABC transporter permease [Anaerolineae bacterium]